MPTLFTIGYEGKTQDEMLAELETARVALVIDVRAVAASRRPGFSKTALAADLKQRGIDYLHLRAKMRYLPLFLRLDPLAAPVVPKPIKVHLRRGGMPMRSSAPARLWNEDRASNSIIRITAW